MWGHQAQEGQQGPELLTPAQGDRGHHFTSRRLIPYLHCHRQGWQCPGPSASPSGPAATETFVFPVSLGAGETGFLSNDPVPFLAVPGLASLLYPIFSSRVFPGLSPPLYDRHLASTALAHSEGPSLSLFLLPPTIWGN